MSDITAQILEQEMQEEDRRFFETEVSETIKNTDEDLCIYKHHAKHKGDFRRELRQGNPDCACIECDGYNNYDCPDYNPRQ